MIRSSSTPIGMSLLAGLAMAASAMATPAHFIPQRVVEGSPTQGGGYTLAERSSVGGAEAPDEAQFYEKMGTLEIDGDGQGNLYVLDNGNCRVQVFDARNRFVRSIGGEGGGPGEFKLPHRLDVNAAGELVVFDLGQGRVSVFDAEGRLKGDFVPGAPVGGVAILDDGRVVLAFEEDRPAPLQCVDASGTVIWSYGEAVPLPANDMVFTVASRSFAPSLTPHGDRILRASDGAYCVLAVSERGQEVDRFARAYDRRKMDLPKPRKNADGEEEGPRLAMITVTETDDGSGPQRDVSVGDGEHSRTFDMDQLKSMMPEWSADVRGLLSWPDRRLWVLTSDADDDRIVTDEWSGSELVRTFELPAYDRFAVGSDGQLYAVSHDEDDFPYVHRLDVTARR